MSVIDFIYLFGGLGLFLYGMKTMADGLEKLAGDRLNGLVEKLTGNLGKGVLMGAGVTAIIQSSSATTVMVIGFINAGVMTLKQAVGVIMGANIGTTITAQIIRLGDITGSSWFLMLLKPNVLGQICVVIGAFLLLFLNKKKRNICIGEVLAGFGILFVGLTGMESAVSALKDMPQFEQAILAFQNPIIGVLVGTGITAILQSSSASIGILQAAAATGMIPLSAAVPIILGQNIGTCITALISSIGANKNAKRAAFIHLSFNIFGTVLFLILLYLTPLAGLYPGWNEATDRGGIANFHTMFNVVNTIILLPFSSLLVKLANTVIRGGGTTAVVSLDERLIHTPSIAIAQAKKESVRMLGIARESVDTVYQMLRNNNLSKMGKMDDNENLIDEMEAKITQYLVKIVDEPLSSEESDHATSMFHVVNDIERIGDHAYNIADITQTIVSEDVLFTQSAVDEFYTVHSAVMEMLDMTLNAYENDNIAVAKKIQPCEDVIDILKETLKTRHINRLAKHECSMKSGIFFLDLLSNYERIADHCSNIGLLIEQEATEDKAYDPHNFLKGLHQQHAEEYEKAFNSFQEKYKV